MMIMIVFNKTEEGEKTYKGKKKNKKRTIKIDNITILV